MKVTLSDNLIQRRKGNPRLECGQLYEVISVDTKGPWGYRIGDIYLATAYPNGRDTEIICLTTGRRFTPEGITCGEVCVRRLQVDETLVISNEEND